PVTIYGSMQIELFQIDGKPEPEEYEDPYNSDTIEHGVDDVFKTVVEATEGAQEEEPETENPETEENVDNTEETSENAETEEALDNGEAVISF
ncbi:MAG: hypothetical protein K6F92_04675, partial [Lachnospiraceae bacterium]|nr:hypothetical protein [Lachnospiraceae bacterium]